MATRVLVVDDAAFMRMMVKDILSKNGYEIVGEAENGMKALEKYQELKAGPRDNGYYDAGDGWHHGSQGDQEGRSGCQGRYVQRNGTAGYGY